MPLAAQCCRNACCAADRWSSESRALACGPDGVVGVPGRAAGRRTSRPEPVACGARRPSALETRRRVHVDPGQVRRAGVPTASSISARVGGRFSGQRVSSQPWPQTTASWCDAGERPDRRPGTRPASGRRRDPARSGHRPGVGGMHVRVDETRHDQRPVQLDHPVRAPGQCDGVLAADPARRCRRRWRARWHRGRRRCAPPVAEQGEGHPRPVHTAPAAVPRSGAPDRLHCPDRRDLRDHCAPI